MLVRYQAGSNRLCKKFGNSGDSEFVKGAPHYVSLQGKRTIEYVAGMPPALCLVDFGDERECVVQANGGANAL